MAHTFFFLACQLRELGLEALCFPRAVEVDYFGERECAPARLAVGQLGGLGLPVHLESLAGGFRPDGEHVTQDGLLVGDALLQLICAARAAGSGGPAALAGQAPTPRFSGIEYVSSRIRRCLAGSSPSRSSAGTSIPMSSQLRLAWVWMAAMCSGSMWPNRPCMAR